MEIIRSIKKMQQIAVNLKLKKKKIGLVPTMGALHEAHMTLIRAAKKENDIVIVSIFVNPAQFGPNEDYKTYPRTLNQDAEKCKKEKVDYIFHPDADKMYVKTHQTYVEVEKLSSILEGKFRPTHFKGVTTIVLKLLNITMPDRAYFGLKDYQQYVIIKKMLENLNICGIIKGMPLVREKDGLAMSSRNRYLSAEERKDALLISKALFFAKNLIKKGRKDSKTIIKEIYNILLKGKLIKTKNIDYVSIIHPDTLQEMKLIKGKCVIVLAIRIGKARLIDNIIV